MSEPTYRQTLSHTWQLVWHHKVLWIFGLLSVLLGQFGLDNFLGQLAVAGSGRAFFGNWAGFASVGTLFKGAAAFWSVWLILIMAGLFILVLLMTVAAQGALIASAGSWFKIRKSPHLGKAWHAGVKHFWRLLLLNIVRKVFFLILLGLVYSALGSVLTVADTTSQIGLIIIFFIAIFLALILSSTTIYAAGYIVIEREDFLIALKRGWNLLWHHFLVSLELNLLFLIIDAVLITVIVMGATWFFIPSFLLIITAGLTGFTGLISVGLTLSLVLFLIFLALLGALHNAFITSAWTYLFMKMHREGLKARLLHLFGIRS